MSPTSDPQTTALETLLGEEAWLRRLAAGLVADAATAEDLTQDVLATAIRERPTTRNPRAWLRTVARRLAIRRGERDRNRLRAERVAARPETVDRRAEARLALHARLTQAIRELEPEARTPLVLRYLEELEYREVAARLGISEPAARKRVSRGLERLRSDLDDEFGQRDEWLGALGILVFGDGWKSPIATALIPAASLGTALAMKQAAALVVTALALFVAVRWWRAPSETDHAPVVASRGPVEPAIVEAESLGLGSARNPAVTRRTVPALESRQLSPPDLAVETPDGSLLVEPRAVWIDEAGAVQTLAVNELGHADLPPESIGRTILAAANGFEMTHTTRSEEEVTTTIVLDRLGKLRGRVEVDGQAPERPFVLRRRSTGTSKGILETLDEAARDRLSASLAVPRESRTATNVDGTFEFVGVHSGDAGTLRLPSSFRTVDPPNGLVSTYEGIDDEVVLSVTRFPHLFGRVIWNDGSPVTCRGTAVYLDELEQETGLQFLWTGANGEFEVGIPGFAPGTTLESLAVRLEFLPTEPMAEAALHQFVLHRAELPANVGTLRLTPVEHVTLLVVDRNGAPVSGARVYSQEETTDSNGELRLMATLDTLVDAFSERHGRGRGLVADLLRDAADRVVLRLEPGVDLFVATPNLSIGSPDSFRGWLGLTHTAQERNTAFEHPFHEHAWRDLAAKREVQCFLGHSERGKSVESMVSLSDDPFVLQHLTPGDVVHLRLTDALRRTLAERRVVIPNDLSDLHVRLGDDLDELGSLSLRVLDEAGDLIPEASIRFLGISGGTRTVGIANGRATVQPLEPGHHRFEATAPFHLRTEASVVLPAGSTSFEVTLPPGRPLAVRFLDAEGGDLAPSRVRWSSSTGWSREETVFQLGSRAEFKGLPIDELRLLLLDEPGQPEFTVPRDVTEFEVRLPQPATGG